MLYEDRLKISGIGLEKRLERHEIRVQYRPGCYKEDIQELSSINTGTRIRNKEAKLQLGSI